jgi:dUTP pyrophosphatase
MNKPNVKVKKLREGAIIPTYGSSYAAGADLYACIDTDQAVIRPHETKLIPTGISLEIPEGYGGFIYARSGIATKRGLAPANKVGVVDSDYRGEVMVALHNHSETDASIDNGERVAQLVIAPFLAVNFTEADELTDTERGEGGFGSTGKK